MSKKFSTTISVGRKRKSSGGFKRFSTKSGSWAKTSDSGSSRGRTSETAAGGTRNGLYKSFASWNPNNKFRQTTKVLAKKGFASKFKGKKLAKVFYVGLAVFIIIGFFGTIGGLAYMQHLTKDLPDPERPFDNEKFQAETSILYDRNGKELYRLFGDDNRDIVKMSDDQELTEVIPPELKWSFLAAEDIDFYDHPGFDVTGIVRCGFKNLSGSSGCGGSTITQQVVKIASLGDNTRSYERKLRELILALQLERKVDDKDRILLLYMNIAPEGGNIYGVKTASRNYFGKDVNDLTLEEAVVLAAIPNNPAYLSPTRSANPELGQELLNTRVTNIYTNLLKYKDKINKEVYKEREALAKKEGREMTEEEKADFITEESINEAKEKHAALEYKDVDEDIRAPHFVFFARDQLTKGQYNNGEAFTLQQINTGGYKIYTTLDLDLQDIALDVVQNVAINQYGARYGNKNAAMMTMVPSTGEIITMVGSKCYNNRELANCDELDDSQGKLFDPKVNILMSQQQPGSSIKPIVYYEAIRQGKIGPASQLADIPIEIGNYDPKNSDGKFTGIHDLRYMISQSRNIPAITALVAVGPDKLAELKKNLGYTINIDPAQYGPSAALGANDVYAVEHATAYATFANGGNYVPYQAILRIEDKNGNVIFDLEGENKPKPKRVLDEKATYLVNDLTNPNGRTSSLSPVKWRGRDMSGKTGTSEENRDTWFVNYSPDFVTVGWSGNNDNTRMGGTAFGSTNTEPWVREFMSRVGESKYFKAKTPYSRPGGIVTQQICNEVTVGGKKVKACEGSSDLLIQGLIPPVYVTKQKAEVCSDQQDRLAREIDKATGYAVEKDFTYARMPVDSLQKYLDDYLKDKQGANGLPTDFCTVNRSPNGKDTPWAEINNPKSGASYTGSISTNINGYTPSGSVTKMEFFLGGTSIGSTSQAKFTGDLNIPGGTLSGTYTFKVVTTSSGGKVGENSVQINIQGVNPNLTLNNPGSPKPALPMNITGSHNGGLSGVHLYVQKDGGEVQDLGVMNQSGGNINMQWDPSNTGGSGNYQLWARSIQGGYTSDQSNTVSVTVL